MKSLGVGRISFWRGGSLWIGRGQWATDLHTHHAIQLCFGIDVPIRLRETAVGNWIDHRAVLIPSMAPHALDARGSISAALFCEPQSEIGRGLVARFGVGRSVTLPGPVKLSEQVAAIGQRMTQGIEPETACQELLADLAGTDTPRPATDPRVLRALDYVATNIDAPTSLSNAAATVELSPSRFRHLFVAEMGIPFRNYVLWLRLQHALQIGLKGATWTQAAHQSGFADSAHLSRTFRKMLGIAPTVIPKRGRRAPFR